ncbi:hypothetical protein DNTS_030340, partial [Danionella cerebrum]
MNPDVILRQVLATVLIHFIQTEPPCHVLGSCLRSLRILSRDKKVLGPLVTDQALLTLARLGGISNTPIAKEEDSCSDADPYDDVMMALSELRSGRLDEGEDDMSSESVDLMVWGSGDWCKERKASTFSNMSLGPSRRKSSVFKALMPGKRDSRGSLGAGDQEEGDEEANRKEVMKVFCNIVYNSAWAQERASELRFVEGGVCVLTSVLERCLCVQWKDHYEVFLEPSAPPVGLEEIQQAQEALKILFNITHSTHTQDPPEEEAALYRRLAAVIRHCLVVSCEEEDAADELKGHAANTLSALPLSCLDVLVSVTPNPDSHQMNGANMDCVHNLLTYMERKLEQILPPLRDASTKPEEGNTTRNRLVRLMTHLDTELKHCAADLLFVLCKE